jgi:sugar phosphate isomerase/epimerase
MKLPSDSETLRFTRRDFVRVAALATAGAALGLDAAPPADVPRSRQIIAFSKPFQTMGPDESAALVEEVGWSGIECPVREKGQIEPERAEDELPRFVEAFRRRNLEVSVLVTDISSMREPQTEKLLRTASKLGIGRIRLGAWVYREDRPIAEQLKEFGGALQDIGQACLELGIKPAVQNHSGSNRFAAPVWDAVSVLNDPKIKNVGMGFDIGHATIEGGLSWPIQARLAEPLYTLVYVKDFRWAKDRDGWNPAWCPLGEGMIHRSFFTRLQRSAYAGPICQHHEYPMGDRQDMVAQMKRDLSVLRDWLS